MGGGGILVMRVLLSSERKRRECIKRGNKENA